MLKRLAKLPQSHSFFLFGARGSGKTTLVRELFSGPNSLYLNLLEYRVYEELALQPDSLQERLAACPDLKTLIIDEVQKLPALLDIVQHLIELNKSLQFILTGSSARKLKRGGANLLAGRAFVINLHPFTFTELGDSWKLEEILSWGSLPSIFKLQSDEDKASYLRAYVNTYLREEILQEQLIRKLEPFQRFLSIASQSSGTILNYSKMSREIGAAPQTIENYFKILEDTLLGFFLPCFHTSRRKQELSSKKFYLFDNGVIRALNRQLDLKINPGTSGFGLAFEHLIIQEFYRLSSYRDKDELLYFYKTQGGLEVDLIIDSPGKALLAIEIKSATRTIEDDIKHLKLFKQIDQKAKPILISRDPARKKIGDIICLPYQEALELFWQGTLHEV